MNSHSRSISELNSQKKDLLEKLTTLETQLGHKLYTKKESSISKEDKDSYKITLENLEETQKTFEEVETLQQSIAETEDDITTDKQKLNELQKPMAEKYAALGQYLYSIYTDDLYDAFGTAYIEAKREETTIDSLNEQQDKIKFDMAKQGFFPKLMSQAKLSTTKASIAMHNKKIADILAKGAKIAFEKSLLDESITSKEIDDCKHQLEAINNQVNHIVFLTESLQSTKEKLSSLPKLAKLQTALAEKSNALDALAQKIGVAYSSLYISSEGEVLKDFAKDYKDLLDEKLQITKAILENTRQSNIRAVEAELEKVLDVVENIEKDIQSDNKKIESLKNDIKELKAQKTDAENQIKALQTKKAELEALVIVIDVT